MKSNHNLISVVMDGIKDANMLYVYAEQAELEGDEAMHQWFRQKADERVHRTEAEWHDAKAVLKLDEADEMGACLKHHVERELAALNAKSV